MARGKVGVQLHPQATTVEEMRAAWKAADALGVDSIWTWDHFYPLYGDPDAAHFEAWTLLSAMAVDTEHARLGLLVGCNSYRNPDLLADMARTVDHISGGRLILGLGTGWYEKDYTTYGYEFGSLAARLDLFDASLRRIDDRLARLRPAPLRPIPILIGGGGERRTLPAVARHAHIWHIYPSGIADYRRKSSLVDELAAANGRLGTDIERSVGWTDADSGEQYLQAGATLFTTSIYPTERGFDFTGLERLLRWRDSVASPPRMDA
jgi:probable F420-dependent oxidoreductase